MTRFIGGPAAVVLVAAVAIAANAFAGGPATVTFAFAIVGAAGAFWSVMQGALWERELRKKSDEIAELNRRTAASVTGGDSWCYLALDGQLDDGNSGTLVLVHQGEYPLYDVSIRIVDLDKFEQIKGNLSLQALAHSDTILNPGNLSPNQASMLGAWEIPEKGLRWNIFFAARNGFFTQRLRLLRVSGHWASATTVIRDALGKEPETLLEKISEDFPRNSEGEVEW